MLLAPLHSHSALRSKCWCYVVWLTAAVLLAITENALAQPDQEHQTYLQAVTKLEKRADATDLQRFVLAAKSESLKREALEWLITDHLRGGRIPGAKAMAQQLLSQEPENALALAVLSGAITQTITVGPNSENAISMARRALRGMPHFRAPELMSQTDFSNLTKSMARNLNGAVGYAYYQRSDYVSARPYLRKAVVLASENAQYTYALAVCDLFARGGDEAEGYRLLARTVNLTQGTPAGQELATFALRKYQEQGGSTTDWDRYLAATRPVRAGAIALAPLGENQDKKQATLGPLRSTAKESTKKSGNSPQNAIVAVSSVTNPNLASGDLRPAPSVQREVASPGAAFSLGILIQTSQVSRQRRQPVINTLSDMVRRLRDGDEAFLVSFSRNVGFEEDLTGNAKLLESAMDQIRPAPGTALLDAIEFAAGHLNRIARNRKRVLLVVSDGQNQTSHISPLEVAGELRIADVAVYCIGMNSNTWDQQYRLRALAARTGGQALFIDDATQFRSAAKRVATDLGIGLQ
jgi:tetratricopeptide (TPR) repeat protein